MAVERESMQYDLVVVGAGPAGLSCACRAKQINPDLSVCVLEKGSGVGAHILSGAIFETRALDELLPDWAELGAPIKTPVLTDHICYLTGEQGSVSIPEFCAPTTMRNQGNYIISLGLFCRWLASQAENLGVDVFPGFAANDILYTDTGAVCGIVTGDMGVDKSGQPGSNFQPGMEIRSHYTVFAEGCRGHLGKQLIKKFELDRDADPQHYALGFKELWKVPSENSKPGHVLHTAGWPLNETKSSGGSFLYHSDGNIVAVGLVVDLAYRNCNLNPFEEFQRHKQHPAIRKHIEGGQRIAYGARTISKGGLQSQPKLYAPGALLVGDDAGTLNFAKIKGTHTAMKSGMLAAEAASAAIASDKFEASLDEYQLAYEASWAHSELVQQRNFGPAQHKFGNLWGSIYAFIDLNVFAGKLPWTLRSSNSDHERLQDRSSCSPIEYPKPDGIISFDKLSSVFLSNTNHSESQPCHLKLEDATIPTAYNLVNFDEPAQRYCPAGVYEIITTDGASSLQINSQNCIHCKACDIKDPKQNITWVPPEGGGGPNYTEM